MLELLEMLLKIPSCNIVCTSWEVSGILTSVSRCRLGISLSLQYQKRRIQIFSFLVEMGGVLKKKYAQTNSNLDFNYE